MKSNLFKTLAPIAVILALVVGGLFALKNTANKEVRMGQEHVEMAIGSTVQDLSLRQFNGQTAPISSLKGKVYLVNFWATWCEACMNEMPSLVKLQALLKDRGFVFVPVNVDEKPEATLPKAISNFKMDFPIYLDTDGKLTEMFDVHGIPFTFVIDQNRKLLMVETGERDWMAPDTLERFKDWLK